MKKGSGESDLHIPLPLLMKRQSPGKAVSTFGTDRCCQSTMEGCAGIAVGAWNSTELLPNHRVRHTQRTARHNATDRTPIHNCEHP